MIPAPFAYFGGKSLLYKWILEHFPVEFPPHSPVINTFVDVFGGSGVITLNAPIRPLNVYNEIDYGLYCLFKQIKTNDIQFQKELGWLARTYSFNGKCNIQCLRPTRYIRVLDLEKIWELMKNANTFNDEASTAMKTFVKYRLSMSGCGKSLAKCNRMRRGMPELQSKFLSSIDNITHISTRLQDVTLENLDFRTLIQKYDSPNTLFYEDPPYWGENRTTKKVYSHEFDEQDHTDLAYLNQTMMGKFLLSSYDCDLYRKLYPTGIGFARFEKAVRMHASTKNIKKTKLEMLIRNY